MNNGEAYKNVVTDFLARRLAQRADRGEDLSGIDLRYANLDGADFRGARMADVNLCHASLRGARFEGADLRCAHFWNADLTGARFDGADLTGADMDYAKIDGAILKGARLTRADLPLQTVTREEIHRSVQMGEALPHRGEKRRSRYA